MSTPKRRAVVLLSVGLGVTIPSLALVLLQTSLKEFLDITRGAGAVTILLIALFVVAVGFYKLFWPFFTERIRRQEDFANARMAAMDLIAKDAIDRSQNLLVELNQKVTGEMVRRDENLTRVLDNLSRRIEDRR